ncbi:MAG: hypothetical protein L3K17_00945 [Thermoplasmata archaeon]|nr:hypothetical protein [Thermoplasmata archaeon]
MRPPPEWPLTALRYLGPALVILLLAQYFLGLWTNVYAPATGFTSNSSSPALDWHYNIGFALGILAILTIVIAALSRQLPLIGTSVVLFLAVLVAGIAGSAFVGSTPNPPSASFWMGAMFLVAFGASMGLTARTWMAARHVPPGAHPGASPT